VTVPGDLAAALEREPAAKASWDGLSFSHQRRHVEHIDGAKTAETRARRVAKAVEMLAADGAR
jgi:uncharacterized protein YdeI (YjbR/CyaY-like superfamily)